MRFSVSSMYLGLLIASATALAPAFAQDDAPPEPTRRFIEDVSTQDVKRFLDPTRMISRLSYDFQMNYLPPDVELMAHEVNPRLALSNAQAV